MVGGVWQRKLPSGSYVDKLHHATFTGKIIRYSAPYQWSKTRVHKDIEASLQTYQVGAHFKALNEPVLVASSDSSTLKLYSIISLFKCETVGPNKPSTPQIRC